MGSRFHVIYKLMKYYLIAGEASGDLYGSQLIREIKNLDQDAQFRCWGGDLMKGEGGDLVKHYKDHNYMGFLEVIVNLKSILKNIVSSHNLTLTGSIDGVNFIFDFLKIQRIH